MPRIILAHIARATRNIAVATIDVVVTCVFVCTILCGPETVAQGPLGGSFAPLSGAPSSSSVPLDVPRTTLTPIGNGGFSYAPNSSVVGNPTFDPYTTGINTGTFQPPVIPPTSFPSTTPSNGSLFGNVFGNSAPIGGSSLFPPARGTSPTPFGPAAIVTAPDNYAPAPVAPTWNSSPYGNNPGFASPAYPTPTYPSPTYPNSIFPSTAPTSLFPGGLFGNAGIGGGAFSGGYRVLQGPRLRHTFINAGDGDDALEINDTDVSIAFALPNFLSSTQPLYIVPSFSLHLWDGPRSITGFDLPSRAFDAFSDFNWQSDPNQILGAELGVRVGVFSDFDAISSKSFRVMGKGLLSFRLTPYATIKGGVYVINREHRKVLPVGGLLYQPDPYTRLDLYFPEPKFARYWRTLGLYDVWGYIAGEYGGGVWTIQRESGVEERVDMYDYRVGVGLEWGESNAIRVGRRAAFTELGVVFRREVEYQNGQTFEPNESFYVRLGFGY